MGVEIKTEKIDVGGTNVLLVSVNGGNSVIGTCSAGYNGVRGDVSSLNRFFYIGSDPVVNVICPNHGNKRADKLISFCPGFLGIDNSIHEALTESFSRLNRGDSLEAGLHDVFALLSDGVYTVYTSEYYPTDGNGTFFWGAYNISHEVHGTAEFNHTIGDKTYRPCFLIPSEPLDMFTTKMKLSTDEAAKSRKIQGIAYHLTGLYSVLLKGHHGAASCADNDIPFKCAVIEKITQPYTEAPIVSENTASPEASAEGQAEEKPTAPVAHDGITGYRSASVKIPLELFPKDMLRQIVESRTESKPEHYKALMQRLSTVRRKSVSNNVVPHAVLEKCDSMPDCEMVESAFAIDNLSDEQLNALLAGETEYDGKMIISPNFYSSIVTACNFLRFHNEQRFVDFSLAILDNPELYATHEYTARRVARLSSNQKVYSFFKQAISSDDDKYQKILDIAEKFVKDYDLQHA